MSTNADNFSVGPETPESLGLPSLFVDFPKGVREGTFFLGGGEGWGILAFFSQKSVGPPLRFNKKNS